jgi:type IV secretory pathway TraG/TraD family ATPase VirD4
MQNVADKDICWAGMPCCLDCGGGLWASTQWAAAMLGNQPRLGAPLTTVLGQPIYAPRRLFEWWYAYEAYAPEIFRTAGTFAAGSGYVPLRGVGSGHH